METLSVYIDLDGRKISGTNTVDCTQYIEVVSGAVARISDAVLEHKDSIRYINVGQISECSSTVVEISADILSQFSNARQIMLEQCCITGGTLADCLENKHELRWLHLVEMKSDCTTVLEKISSLSSLERLYIFDTDIGTDAVDLSSTKIKRVWFYGVKLSKFPVLPSTIEELVLGHNGTVDVSTVDWSKYSKLKQFYVNGTVFAGTIPEEIAQLIKYA